MERQIAMRLSGFVPSLFVTGALACAALSGSAEHQAPAGQNEPQHPSQRQGPQADEGQRVFQQNCSRCHNAPEAFPPSLTGTIVRHMRVRANLSRHDEKVLLDFLNP
jgi:cytochrome c5